MSGQDAARPEHFQYRVKPLRGPQVVVIGQMGLEHDATGDRFRIGSRWFTWAEVSRVTLCSE
jgi:hypothetical protein